MVSWYLTYMELNSSDRQIVCGSRDSTPEELQLNGTCCVSILATIHTMSTIGRRVKICGLKSLKDLNGGEGVVQEELLNGRLRVLMTNFFQSRHFCGPRKSSFHLAQRSYSGHL